MSPCRQVRLIDIPPPWRGARTLVERLLAAVGGPVTIATLGALTPAMRTVILRLVRAIEAMTRTAILLEALARTTLRRPLPPRLERAGRALRPPSLPRTIKAPPTREEEAGFRVSFGLPSLRELSASCATQRAAADAARSDLADPEPLARRLQAAIDALEDPEPHIRRVAARIGIAPSPPSPDRPLPAKGWREALLVAEAQAMLAAAGFDSG